MVGGLNRHGRAGERCAPCRGCLWRGAALCAAVNGSVHPSDNGGMEHDSLYQHLVEVARSRRERTISYTEAGKTIGLAANDRDLFDHLDEINRFERRQGRPMLSALVVGRQTGIPGAGFFRLAREWGINIRNERRFWRSELKRLRRHWNHK